MGFGVCSFSNQQTQVDVALLILSKPSPTSPWFAGRAGMELPGGTAFHFDSYGGNTALHLAAARGDATIVRELLLAGSNVAATNNRGDTPLHLAAVQVPPAAPCALRQQRRVLARLGKTARPANPKDERRAARVVPAVCLPPAVLIA